jgi:hypothetical protein
VLDGNFADKNLGPNAFKNPFPGLVPFNVQNINGEIYVTYALPGRAAQIAAKEGDGGVAVYDENGNLLRTLINGSKLASPWGLALAPAGFGEFANDLLVGNFSFVASEINAFDPVTGAFLGTIPVDDGGNGAGGLWALIFGNGGSGGDPNTLYFSDGIAGETHGLFAAIARGSAHDIASPSAPGAQREAPGSLSLIFHRCISGEDRGLAVILFAYELGCGGEIDPDDWLGCAGPQRIAAHLAFNAARHLPTAAADHALLENLAQHRPMQGACGRRGEKGSKQWHLAVNNTYSM